MSVGLKIPVGVDERGRAAVETNESENTRKLIILALQEGGDDNPFQDIGLPGAIIFSVMDITFQGKATRAIRAIMKKFSAIGLARLEDSTPITFTEGEEGEGIVDFTYTDLLTGERQVFEHRFIR